MEKFYNFEILNAVADFLYSDFENTVTDDVKSIMQSGVTDEYAVSLLIGEGGGLDTFGADRELFSRYFPLCVKKQDPNEYTKNEYCKNVVFKGQKLGNSELCNLKYNAYEPFVSDDINLHFDGTLLPKIGFFDEEFTYPAVKENGRIWMTVTPNEINTMKEPINRARGKVLTLGLGLGYFAYSAIIKADVSSVTVVEQNEQITDLFKKHILPYFPKDKSLNIIKADALEYMENPPENDFDFIFCDIWRDVSDGVPLYKRLKAFEKNFPRAKIEYWIEKSMKFYL